MYDALHHKPLTHRSPIPVHRPGRTHPFVNFLSVDGTLPHPKQEPADSNSVLCSSTDLCVGEFVDLTGVLSLLLHKRTEASFL